MISSTTSRVTSMGVMIVFFLYSLKLPKRVSAMPMPP
jgi:hypothetical protein